MKKLIFPLLFSLSLLMTSCDNLADILGESSDALSTEEVVSGLKEALEVGTDSAVAVLGITNGYYGNDLYKILLPDEANQAISYLENVPGGSDMIENVIKGINRAAENAASEAAPIFVDAITDMTIADGWNILNGADTAATHYLRTSTNAALFNLYNPKIESSLNKDLGLGFTANSAWNTLTSNWNTVANSMAGQILGYKAINTDLDSYLTQKALNGMYLKIAAEEKNIRQDPLARVSDILQKVFGSLD